MTMTPEQIQSLIDKQTAQIKADFEAREKQMKDELEATKAEHGKLSKIFEDRQTKQINPEFLAKAFGINVEGEKVDPIAVINEKLSGFANEVKDLNEKLSKSEIEKLNILKQNRVKEEISKFDFVDVELVSKLVNADSETLSEDIKKIAEERKYLLKQADTFGTGNMPNAGTLTTLQQEFETLVSKPKLTNADKARLEILPSLLKQHKGK